MAKNKTWDDDNFFDKNGQKDAEKMKICLDNVVPKQPREE